MKLYRILVRNKNAEPLGYKYAMADSLIEAKRLLKYNFGWIGTFGDWSEIHYSKK